MILISQLKIGLPVFNNRSFAGVPAGSPGTIVDAPNSWPETESVAVKWIRNPGDELTDWFSFDDLQYLELVNAPQPEDEDEDADEVLDEMNRDYNRMISESLKRFG